MKHRAVVISGVKAVTFSLAAVVSSAACAADAEYTYSAGDTWSGTLDIVTDAAAGQIRFGTGETALTADQLEAIRLNGKRVRLGADGRLKEKSGLGIIVL